MPLYHGCVPLCVKPSFDDVSSHESKLVWLLCIFCCCCSLPYSYRRRVFRRIELADERAFDGLMLEFSLDGAESVLELE
jgi:hypothetical protein